MLLILAGVTLSLTLGENGLLRRAEESKSAHLAGEKNDIEFMNSAYEYMNPYFGEGVLEVIHRIERVEAEIPVPEGGTIYTDEDGAKIPIPRDFKYKEGTEATGLVITEEANENEFVWVPVKYVIAENGKVEEKTKDRIIIEAKNEKTQIKRGVLYNFSGTTATAKEIVPPTYPTGYREPDVVASSSSCDGKTEYLTVVNNILGTNYTTSDQFRNALQADYNEMVASVTKYKGFYVERYETSLDENKKAKSKVGVLPETAVTTSANTWYGLYAYQKKMAQDNNYTSVKSHMIWGSNYDAMLRWALIGEDSVKVTETGNAKHSGAGDLYESGKITVEGKIDRINNIYDLEGNGREWTAESDGNGRSIRGGDYINVASPDYRKYSYSGNSYSNYCSRAIFYIN